MKSTCDKLRQHALARGLDSEHGVAWRLHARTCKDCRTELRILEKLERQARDERQHFRRQEINALLYQVQIQREEQEDAAGGSWGWTLKFAFVIVVAGVFAQLQWGVFSSLVNLPWQTTMARRPPDPAGIVPLAPGAADGRSATQRVPGTTVEGTVPIVVPSEDLRERLLDIRDRVDTRRTQILEMIETDLSGGEREDAWRQSHPPMLPLA